MDRFARLITYRNLLRTERSCKIVQGDVETIRTYSSKKTDMVDRLEGLEKKIQTVVGHATTKALPQKCKEPDTSLPDCKVSRAKVDPGRRHPVRPIPTALRLPKYNPNDVCVRPYVNPCPPHPLRECCACYRPIHPCRGPCKKPKYKIPEDNKIMQLEMWMMKALLALTTISGAYIIYRLQ